MVYKWGQSDACMERKVSCIAYCVLSLLFHASIPLMRTNGLALKVKVVFPVTSMGVLSRTFEEAEHMAARTSPSNKEHSPYEVEDGGGGCPLQL